MNTHAVLLIAVSALVTALIRFAPFLVFRGGRETPAVILRLGKLLPCAVMSMLVVYCLRNMDFASSPEPSFTCCSCSLCLCNGIRIGKGL